MKKFIPLLPVLLLALLTACNNQNESACFKTREDSLAFAQAVIKMYDTATKPESVTIMERDAQKFSTTAFAPLPWQSVVDFANAHDTTPLFRLGGVPVKGLMVDATGLNYLRALPAATYSKLYLRFGKKTDGSYTVMILPVKTNGQVEMVDNKNYDHLDPCPSSCPTNFQ